MAKRPKLIRIVTVPMAFRFLLWGQLKWMKLYFDLIAVSTPGDDLVYVANESQVRTVGISMTRIISPIKDLVSLIRMIRLFLKEKPDIVHTHTPKAGLIGMLAAWITRVPIRIHTVAGLPLMTTSGGKRLLLVGIEWLTYACSTASLPNSRGLFTYIRDTLHIRLPQLQFLEPGSTSGVDFDYFSRTPEVMAMAQMHRNSPLFKDRFVFVFAGRLVKDKGVEELVEAFVRLSQEYEAISLILVGGFESELDPISEATRQVLNSHPHIFLTGHTPDVRPYLAASDVLVLPSYREGLPQILLQACALDLPCIATDIMGCNDVIIHGKNGLLVEVGSVESLYQALREILTNRSLFERLRTHVRASISQFSCKAIWTHLLHFYHRELTQKGISFD